MKSENRKDQSLFEMEFEPVNDRLGSQSAGGMNPRMHDGIIQFRAIPDEDRPGRYRVNIRIGADYMREMDWVAGDTVNIVYNSANSY
ncbi:MAG: hypothetical protein LC650_05625, partial [Actinobacteria bacterium]|nr:hypothetical protein [Actinomycetota bacterium]